MRFIKTINVDYCDSSRHSGDIDINAGMGGKYVYLDPEYTSNRSEAASLFVFEMTRTQDYCAADLSKGDGKKFYRYLSPYYPFRGYVAITRVWLSNDENEKCDGRTPDLNKDRGGSFLYLCWDYEKQEQTRQFWPYLAAILDMHLPVLGLLLAEKQVSADHPIYTLDACRDNMPQHFQVDLGDMLFSQNSVRNQFNDHLSPDENIQKMIVQLFDINWQDREAIIQARFGGEPLTVTPIRRRTVGEDSTSELFLSLDNRRLIVMRAVLPPTYSVNVRRASPEERKDLRWKWTSTNDGYSIRIRGNEFPQVPKGSRKPNHNEL